MKNLSCWPRLLATVALGLGCGGALAHGGEDHVHATPAQQAAQPAKVVQPAQPAFAAAPSSANTAAAGAALREAPQRLGDGSLFVPKAVQRQLTVRTQRTVSEALLTTVELNGVVVVDPGGAGRVQAAQAGTVRPLGTGFPALGQRVRKGQVLAWLQPAAGALERADLAARQAELRGDEVVAERRVARLEQLEGSVPHKEIEAARVALRTVQAQRAALLNGIEGRQPLRSPVDGVLSAVQAGAGEMVEAQATVFEVIDPTRLAVEAPVYDLALAAQAVGAQGLVGDTPVPLQPTGVGRLLRQHALPMRFKVLPSTAPLAVGQPLRVLLQTRASVQGIAVAQTALARNGAGQTVVWVHPQPELFVARVVRQQPLDAQRVVILEGLKPGERVVTQGAALLAQVR